MGLKQVRLGECKPGDFVTLPNGKRTKLTAVNERWAIGVDLISNERVVVSVTDLATEVVPSERNITGMRGRK